MRPLLSAALVSLLLSSAHAGPPGPTPPALATTFGASSSVELAPHTATTTPTVRRLSNIAVATTGATPAARATDFLARFRAPLGLTHVRLAEAQTTTLPRGLGHVVRFDVSTINHLDVRDMSVSVRLDRDGQVRSYTSDVLPFTAPSAPEVTAETALANARAAYSGAAFGTPRLFVEVPASHHATLVWRIPVALVPMQAHFFASVDAMTGAVLRATPAGFDQPVRALPTLVRSEDSK